jgi:PAS domain S-box-containing protein
LAQLPPSFEPYRQDLALVQRNGLRLLKLVNTLLDFSRIEAGRIQACYEPTDVTAFTADLASVFRSAIEKAGLRFKIACEDPGEAVFIDREMWEKIVFNLISNAFKYTLQGEITVSVARAGDTVELKVADTGIGIDEQNLPRIFDRFHRIESARGRSQEGSGIGLALVYELTKLHGGTIRVSSIVGQGTVFTVAIPLGCSHLPAERIGKPRSQASTALAARPYVEEALRWLSDPPPPSGALHDTGALVLEEEAAKVVPQTGVRRRVLVADDNADMREYLRRLLGEHYEVQTVADGESALSFLPDFKPDLVLADVMMPGIDGFGLLRRLRSDAAARTLPVILLSARAGEEARVEGLQAGADDYVVKPFSARELLARVASRLEIAALRQQAAEAEHRLRMEAEAERQRLRDLIRKAPAIVAVLRGPEHVFELVNEQYLIAVGRTEDDLIGKPILEALPEIRDQAFIQLLDTVYRTGEPFVGSEMRAYLDRRRDGSPEERYFTFVYQPSKDASGQTEGILVHAVDVSEHVFARRRLEESEQQLKTLADSIPQMAWMAEPDGYRFWFNRRWYEYTGSTLEQMVGWGWESVHHEEYLPQVLERWHESLRTGAEFEMEFPIRGADGGFRWFLTRVTPLKNRAGSIFRWFGTNTDITDLKRSRDERAALLEREQEARATAELLNQVGPTLLRQLELKQIVQSVTDVASAAINAEFGAFFYNMVNEKGESCMLYTLSGAPREAFEEFSMPSNTRLFGATFRGEGVVRSDDVLKDHRCGKNPPYHGMPPGHLPVRSYLAVPVMNHGGEVLGGLFLGHSLAGKFTERHDKIVAGIAAQAAIAMDNARLFEQAQRVQQALQRSNDDLRRAYKDMETFAYSASHDLQEPLRNVALCAQLLQRDYQDQLQGSASKFIETIVNGALRMQGLVKDLLTYTRLTQSLTGAAAAADGNEVLAGVLSDLKPNIEANGALVISDSLPRVAMQHSHLALLLQNLISNSLKYRGKQAPRIHVTAAARDAGWTFSVADNGMGIDHPYQAKIFELFQRLHSRDKYPGSGIGLAICQRIVEQYGGRIWVESDGKTGSTFFFSVPN